MAKRPTVDAWTRRQIMLAWKRHKKQPPESLMRRRLMRSLPRLMVRLGAGGLRYLGRAHHPVAF